MSRADEEWVKAAMTDDTMVVELLVQLHHTSPPLVKPAALQLDWSVRQRRSKSITVDKITKKPAHRASPTTPLSWSGATTASCGSGGTGGGGFEESSRHVSLKISNTTRSKVDGVSERTSCKRSRKKKTLAQLKEEENFLVKERRELNKEISALQMNLDKQRAMNESLRRMKLELQPHMNRRTFSTEESVSIPYFLPPIVSTSNGCLKQNGNAASDPPKFVLPDLNMPSFEDSCSDVICGVS